MFPKLARWVVIFASLLIVVSRTLLSFPAPHRLSEASGRLGGADSPCVVSQLPARKA